MIARRDMLKMAVALSAARALPSALSPEEAAALLAAPASAADVGLDRDRFGPGSVVDPAWFAGDLDGSGPEALFDFVAPEEHARYVQARGEVEAALPILGDLRFDHPWHRMDQAAQEYALVAYMRGLAYGAKYEALRREMLGPTRVCPGCHGRGALWDGSPYGASGEREACERCRGAGTVPTPAPALALAGD